MRARSRVAVRAVVVAALVAVIFAAWSPLEARSATPGPSEPCVAGTIWEDLSSGVKYICIYDELYGGTRWELLSTGQTGSSLFTYRSTIHGCTFNIVALSRASGGGGNSFVRSFRWPCVDFGDRMSQPAGELRVRTVLQRFGTSWTTCRDTGFAYSNTTAWSLVGGVDMGASPDCGVGIYRTWGTGQLYQGGAWRGASLATPALHID
jgi:hypothetical protein